MQKESGITYKISAPGKKAERETNKNLYWANIYVSAMGDLLHIG